MLETRRSGGNVGGAIFGSLLADGLWGADLTSAARGTLGMDHLAPDLGPLSVTSFVSVKLVE